MIAIEFNNRTKYNFPKSAVLNALNNANNVLRVKKKQILSVAFVGSTEMKKINKQYRRKNKATDVLSFKVEASDCTGEIIICPAQAKKQAKEFGQSYKKEIVKLALH
ncbi:MAG: rRNA maturation RNase YbeY, partial [Patescibacteria group bacterium]